MDPRRSERVSEALREELEELIVYELTDPRVQASAVAEVLISPDGRRAHVRVVLNGGPESEAETLAALDHARGFLRREIAQRVDLFRVPDFHFEAALPTELGVRAKHLLRRIRRGRPRPEVESAPDAGEGSENV